MIKKTLIAISFISILGLIILFSYTHNRTYLNNHDITGNTIGNIFNGGLFCEQNNMIYFSNINDKGKLYRMDSNLENLVKINNDKIAYINVDKTYLYYNRINNRENTVSRIFPYNNTGTYRINKNGGNLKSMSRNPAAFLILKGNYLYYQSYEADKGINLYQQKIDGSNEKLLLSGNIMPFNIDKDHLYYSGANDNHNINDLNLNNKNTKTYISGDFMFPLKHGNSIYYISPKDNYTIWQTNLNHSEPTKLVNYRCSTFNISSNGKYLYYQIDDNKNNSINVLNLEDYTSQHILDGNYKNINITKKYIFFNDFNETQTFILESNGKTKAQIFEITTENKDSKDKTKKK